MIGPEVHQSSWEVVQTNGSSIPASSSAGLAADSAGLILVSNDEDESATTLGVWRLNFNPRTKFMEVNRCKHAGPAPSSRVGFDMSIWDG